MANFLLSAYLCHFVTIAMANVKLKKDIYTWQSGKLAKINFYLFGEDRGWGAEYPFNARSFKYVIMFILYNMKWTNIICTAFLLIFCSFDMHLTC